MTVKNGARMIRAAYEWMDGLVSAYVRVNHPGDTVIAAYAMSRGQLPGPVREAIASVLPGTEPAGWGCVTLFALPHGEDGRETHARIAAAIRKAGPGEPMHLDLYRRGELSDRAHL